MNQQSIVSDIQTPSNSSPTNKENKTWVHSRHFWLRVQQMLCLLFICFDLIILLASLPGFYNLLFTYCIGFAQSCPPDGKLYASDYQTLIALHISINTYVLVNFIFGLLFALTYITVGLLLLRTKFNEPFCLFTAFWLITFGTSVINSSASESLLFVHPYPFILVLWQYIEPCVWILLAPFFLLFPDGRFVPRWTWLLCIPFFLLFLTFKLSQISPHSPFAVTNIHEWLLGVISVLGFGSLWW